MISKDPWEHDLPEPSASLNLPEPVTASKHPSFDLLRPSERLDLFTDIQAESPGEPIEIVLRKAGISEKVYKEIIDDSDYMLMLHRKCISRRLGPSMAKVYDVVLEGALAGDAAMVKTIMGTGANLSPDNVTLVNQNLMNMSTPELMKELEFMQDELKKQSGDD